VQERCSNRCAALPESLDIQQQQIAVVASAVLSTSAGCFETFVQFVENKAVRPTKMKFRVGRKAGGLTTKIARTLRKLTV
jgi:hypothetical protein